MFLGLSNQSFTDRLEQRPVSHITSISKASRPVAGQSVAGQHHGWSVPWLVSPVVRPAMAPQIHLSSCPSLRAHCVPAVAQTSPPCKAEQAQEAFPGCTVTFLSSDTSAMPPAPSEPVAAKGMVPHLSACSNPGDPAKIQSPGHTQSHGLRVLERVRGAVTVSALMEALRGPCGQIWGQAGPNQDFLSLL